MTELDDLKTAWKTLSLQIERQNALATQQLRETKRARFRSGFRLVIIGQVIQIIAGALLALLGGRFWTENLGVVHLMVYGISVHAYGVMLIIFAARDLFLVRSLDYAAPVLALQKRIAQLRAWHVRAGWWFGVAGCFIWIPFTLMIFFWLGADLWTRNPEVVGWFFLSGVVCVVPLAALAWWLRRPGRERLAGKIEDHAVGYSVRRAQAMLNEIALFERE